jgi:hypothetical protein
MCPEALLAASTDADEQCTTGTCRLAVAWQHPESRSIQPVGLLEQEADGYRFRYIRNADAVPDFRSLPTFPDLAGDYRSSQLFPLFRQRVMRPHRPDYGRWLEAMDLVDPTPFEFLARTEGRRQGDTIMVIPEPVVSATGETVSHFMVHGIRHRPDAEGALSRLRAGDELSLMDEPTNPIDRLALLVTRGTQPLGWVPHVLLAYVRTVRDTGPVVVTAERVNGPDFPPHFRLLARLEGTVPIGHRPFAGGLWTPRA